MRATSRFTPLSSQAAAGLEKRQIPLTPARTATIRKTPKKPLECLEALTGDLEHLGGIEVLRERASQVDPQVDAGAVGACVAVVHARVGTGDDGGDVGADRRGGGELPPSGSAARRLAGGSAVGDDNPPGRGVDAQVEHRFQVGLIETGVHQVRVERFE